MMASDAQRGSRCRNQSYSPSPANGAGACVFIPAGLFTTSRCSSSNRSKAPDLAGSQLATGQMLVVVGLKMFVECSCGKVQLKAGLPGGCSVIPQAHHF